MDKILKRYLKKIINFLLPADTRRRAIALFIFKTFKKPSTVLRRLNIHMIIKFMKCLFTEDRHVFKKKLEAFFGTNEVIQHDDTITFKMFVPQQEPLIFKKANKPTVSIIIPAFNQWNYTFSCLGSILENTIDVSYEIIVADDVSSDETINIAKHVQNIVVVRNEENRGFLLNCNNAATYAKGKYILFLNNDTNVQENWLKPLVDLIESDEQIGMVGSKLVFPDGRLQEAGGIIWRDASGCNFGRLDDPQKPEYNYVKEVDYISGASIMIRRNLWREIGGFDERYSPAYFEDADMAFEVRRHGYKVVFQPNSVVVHFEGISHGTDVNSGVKSYQVKNQAKFVDKWELILQSENMVNGQNLFAARDRSTKKKTILVVEHMVPMFDKDAGSRTTFQYLKLFKKLGLNVKFYGHNFFAVNVPYVKHIQQLGIEILYGGEGFFDTWIKENGDKIDYSYLIRPHVAIEYIDLIKQSTKSKIIYNGADFHWIREERQYALDKDPETLNRAKYYKRIEFELFTKSDIVITISDFEKKLLEKEMPGKKVVIKPTFIYEQDFPVGTDSILSNRTFATFVGGFLHKPNEDGMLWFNQDIWPQVVRDRPQIDLKIVGSNPPETILNLAKNKVEVTGYVSDEKLEEFYSNTRVIVAPLRFGAGVKGKIIEAIAHGIPVVTTSIGAEGISNAENILTIEDDESKFAQSIIRLFEDDSLWQEKREACIEYARNNFSEKRAEEILVRHILN